MRQCDMGSWGPSGDSRGTAHLPRGTQGRQTAEVAALCLAVAARWCVPPPHLPTSDLSHWVLAPPSPTL